MAVQTSLQALGATIRLIRLERGLTIAQLSRRAGVHPTYLAGIESGVRNPSWNNLRAVARGLGIEVSEIARRAETTADGS